MSDNQVDEIFLKSVVYDNGTHQRYTVLSLFEELDRCKRNLSCYHHQSRYLVYQPKQNYLDFSYLIECYIAAFVVTLNSNNRKTLKEL